MNNARNCVAGTYSGENADGWNLMQMNRIGLSSLLIILLPLAACQDVCESNGRIAGAVRR